MSFAMQPAQFPHGGWPEGLERTPGSDQTYPRGTPVTWDEASQELDEHALGATVTNILGVTLEGVVAGDAQNPSGKVSFARSSRSNIFVAKLVDAAGVVQTVDAANIGVQYGMLKVSTGMDMWFGVDESEVAAVVCEVVGIDTERNLVYFKFLEAAIEEL